MAFQTSGFALDIWRLIAGIGIGVELVTIDTYISELIPSGERGRAYAVNQFITFSVVPVVAFLAYVLKGTQPLGLEYWRVVILIGSVGRGDRLDPAPQDSRKPALARASRPHRRSRAYRRGYRTPRHGRKRRRAAGTTTGLTPNRRARGSYKEIFGPRYRTRTFILSIFNMAQVIGFYGFAAWVPTLLIHRGIHVTASLGYAFVIAIANPFGPLLGMWFADKLERKTQICGGLITMARGHRGVLTGFRAVVADRARRAVHAGREHHVLCVPRLSGRAVIRPACGPRAIGFVYSWSRISAAFAGLAIGILLHGLWRAGRGGVHRRSMLVGICMILLGPSTKGLALETINH